MPKIFHGSCKNIHTYLMYVPNLLFLLRKQFWCEQSLSIITGDFNTRSSSWCSNDISITEGSKLLSLTSSNGFPQLINEPTYIPKQTALPALIYFLLISQFYQQILESMHLCIQIVIIKFYILILTLIFPTRHLMNN